MRYHTGAAETAPSTCGFHFSRQKASDHADTVRARSLHRDVALRADVPNCVSTQGMSPPRRQFVTCVGPQGTVSRARDNAPSGQQYRHSGRRKLAAHQVNVHFTAVRSPLIASAPLLTQARQNHLHESFGCNNGMSGSVEGVVFVVQNLRGYSS